MQSSEVERQREHFNRIESRYFAGRREATHQRLKDLMWADALRSLPETAGRRLEVLEPMCGYAEGKAILERHLSAELDYSGFDYSDDVVERARAAHPSERIWQADVTTFEPEAQQYDGIIL